jgi:sugar-specific transcriptional regulator TrmB
MINTYNIQELETFLTDYGLTPKQARVYLASLQLGAASVQAIAQAAQTERTNAYDAIEALVAKRLMSITVLGKKNLYLAEPPENLGRILEERKADLDRLLPELRSLHNVSETKPRIRYYPGIQGYKAVYEDTLTAVTKEMVGIYSVQDIIDVVGREYVDRVVERRIKAGISLRVVRSREREIPGVYPNSNEALREMRLAPAGMVFPIVTYVYDNKVIFLSSKKETFGLIMESEDIAQANKNYFEALWQISS